MKKRQTVKTAEAIDYLTRYSNNLLAVSPLQPIDIASTKQNKDKLYRNYVYADVKCLWHKLSRY